MNSVWYLKILVRNFMLFLCVSDTLGSEECIFEPSDLAVFLDMTANVDGEQGEQMKELAKVITSRSPAESKVSVYSLGDRVIDIVSGVESGLNLSWAEDLHIRQDIKQFGDTLSSTAIDNELKRRFSVSQYKYKAEIVILIVSSASKINILPNSYINKKKTLVIAFGSSVPSVYKDIASRGDHLYRVGHRDELEAVTDKLLKQIACDSNYYCDTDMYSLKKGYKCRKCSSVCSEDVVERTMTCEKRCPFLRSKSSDQDSDVNQVDAPDSSLDIVTEDNKYLVIGGIVGVIVILVLVVLASLVLVYKLNYRKKHPPLTPSSSDNTLPKRPFGPEYDKMPIEETEGESTPQEQQPFLGSDEASAQTDQPDVDATNSVSGGGTIHLDFKNKREMDLNGHYSDHNVIFMNEKKTRDTVPIDEQKEKRTGGTLPLDDRKEEKGRGTFPLEDQKEEKRITIPLNGLEEV